MGIITREIWHKRIKNQQVYQWFQKRTYNNVKIIHFQGPLGFKNKGRNTKVRNLW